MSHTTTCPSDPDLSRARRGSPTRSFIAALVLLPGLALPAAAPAASGAHGTLIVGPGASAPLTAAARGRWRVESGLVTRAAGTHDDASWAYWIAAGPGLADGTLRARFRCRGRLDATLLLRGTLRARQGLVGGHGLRIDRDRAYFVRVDRDGRGLSRVGGVHYLLGVRKRHLVEVVVQVFGEHMVAAVFAGRTRTRLAVLALQVDRRATAAAVGLALGQRSDAALVELTARRACHGRPASGDPARLYVGIAAPTLPPGARSLGTEVERGRTPGGVEQVVLETDLARLEPLVCSGARLLSVSGLRPWKYVVGGDYLALRDRPPLTGDDGAPVIDRSYKSPEMVAALLQTWHRRHPTRTRLVEIGRSHRGRPVQALFIGDHLRADDPRPTVLLDGGHHGTEPLSVEIVLDAIQTLLERPASPRIRRILRELVVCAVPVVNPDGLHGYLEVSLLMGRKNGRDDNGDGMTGVYEGVDLNRNYPFGWDARVSRRDTQRRDWHYYRGPAAASEPEVRAMIALADRERFVAAVSYHSGAIAFHVPYTVAGKRSPHPDAALAVAGEIVRSLGRHPQGRRFALRRTIHDVSGSAQDFHRHAHGTLALVVEAARATPRTRQERSAVIDALRPSWSLLLSRYLEGPSIHGQVRDARSGRPIAAEVRVLEISLREGERWGTRPRDGRFDRFLPAAGRYRIRASAPGHAPAEQLIEVSRRQRRRVDFRLSPAR